MRRNGDLVRAVHLMSTNEAAELLGVSRQRIHQMIKEDKIDFYQYGSRKFLHRSEVERLASKREAKAS